MDAGRTVGRVGCPPPLLPRRPRARGGRPAGGEAHRRRGAVARRRRPPGAAVRGARPQGRPRRDGARARPRPAPGVPAGARGHAARRSSTRTCRSPSCRSTPRPRTTSGRGSRPRRASTGRRAEARLAAWRERMAHYQEQRIHPQLPLKQTICFYPMSKRRATGGELVLAAVRGAEAAHGAATRASAAPTPGRVLQLITGSTGLDDWEWGVTLLADDPVALKEIVYEMRFDPGVRRLRGVRSVRHRAAARAGRGAAARRALTERGGRPCRSTCACSCRSPRSSSTAR